MTFRLIFSSPFSTNHKTKSMYSFPTTGSPMMNRHIDTHTVARLPATLALEKAMAMLHQSPLLKNELLFEDRKRPLPASSSHPALTEMADRAKDQVKRRRSSYPLTLESCSDFPTIEWYFSDHSKCSTVSDDDNDDSENAEKDIPHISALPKRKNTKVLQQFILDTTDKLNEDQRRRLVRSHSFISHLSSQVCRDY